MSDMNSYTLHLPPGAEPGDAEALEEAELVKDGFSWGAFFFTAFWFFWHRLWLAGLMVLAAILALSFALQALRVGAGAAFVSGLLLSILIGLEASSLRQWSLNRRKPAVGVVTAADLDEAESKALARWLAADEQRVSHAAPAAVPHRRAEPVIGLFPDAERRR
jgi:hypothetical protein